VRLLADDISYGTSLLAIRTDLDNVQVQAVLIENQITQVGRIEAY